MEQAMVCPQRCGNQKEILKTIRKFVGRQQFLVIEANMSVYS